MNLGDTDQAMNMQAKQNLHFCIWHKFCFSDSFLCMYFMFLNNIYP